MAIKNADPAVTGEKTFTQAEVDAIVKERLERERKRFNADADAVADLQQKLAAMQSELDTVKKQAAEKESAFASEKIRSGIVQLLDKANVINSETMSQLFIDITKLDEDGKLVMTGNDTETLPAADYIKNWAKSNSWAVRNTQKAGSGMEGKPKSVTREDLLRKAFGLNEKEV